MVSSVWSQQLSALVRGAVAAPSRGWWRNKGLALLRQTGKKACTRLPMACQDPLQSSASATDMSADGLAAAQRSHARSRVTPTWTTHQGLDHLNPRRSSWSPGQAGQSSQGTPRGGGAGYYIPPPGYRARPHRSTSPEGDSPEGDKQNRTEVPIYGGHGVWKPLHDNNRDWIPIIRNEHRMHDIFSRLIHSDWNIPQAQRVLSTWATLATLLAGTQTTLLTFYERDKTSTYIALSFAALFLEIYGALLASINIMISISLQASQASQDARQTGGSDTQKAEADLRISQGFKWQWMGPATSADLLASNPIPSLPRRQNFSDKDRREQRATTIALCILDRLTVSCGFIIPVGGMLQLTGLTIYAVQTHPGPAVYSLVGAILFAFSITLLGLGQGLYTGNTLYVRARATSPNSYRRAVDREEDVPNLPSRQSRAEEEEKTSSASSRSSHAGIRRPDYGLDDDEDLYDHHGSTQRLMSSAVLNAVVIA